MEITASLVKELRDKTGAGMMDCKKALQECDGDVARAVDWLREKGIAKAAKKAGRIAAEGLTRVLVSGNRAALVEVNSETDFVAKNEQFIKLLDDTTKAILDNNPADVDAALQLTVNGQKLEDVIVSAIATIGEKITLRRFVVVDKAESDAFGSYMHMGGKISAVAVIKNSTDLDVAKDMAMQVASMSPQFISQAHMDAEFIEHEKSIQMEIIKNDESLADKPEKVLEGIVRGRLSKSLQDISLIDQVYFKDQDKKVSQFLKENNTEVVTFVRYAVGDGLEKKEDNFAEEVMNTSF
ncbi:MAG: translation elongation factor Ts [Erysipelotrichaceae bacterium]|nr:translation elongation factor Ts [Erysipelotrichaceae bacterium]